MEANKMSSDISSMYKTTCGTDYTKIEVNFINNMLIDENINNDSKSKLFSNSIDSASKTSVEEIHQIDDSDKDET